MDRALASVQVVSQIQPIPNAENIELVKVLGWQCVSKKGEFEQGDLCVFFEVDSILPFMPWSEFLRRKDNPDKPIRLKTIRLRGALSQGLCLPLSILPQSDYYNEGYNCTEILGVKKHEVHIPAQLAGTIKGNFPSFLRKTDSFRLQSYPEFLNEITGKDVYITVKMDGTSSTFYHKDGEFGVCSRNLEQKECSSVYWDMAEKYHLKEKLLAIGKNIAISAETFGQGIQKNKMGSLDVQCWAFDVWDIDNQRYFNFDEQRLFLETIGMPSVPLIYRGAFNWKSIDELLDLASAQKYTNNAPAEGIVIRPTTEEQSHVLRGDRLAFKVISNSFLLKHSE